MFDSADDLMRWVDAQRRHTVVRLDPEAQRKHAQFFTPAAVAELMASMLPPKAGTYRLLDPGAGIGVLAAAAVGRIVTATPRPSQIHITAYEIDAALTSDLEKVLAATAAFASRHGVVLTSEVRRRDFLEHAAGLVPEKGEVPAEDYDAAILNPPYGKIAAQSDARRYARALGLEVANVYAAFWAAAIRLTRRGGDVVVISPRSFCNGTYFRDFRRFLLQQTSIRHLHVFDARNVAFSEQSVLQENLISHVEVGAPRGDVLVTAQGPTGDDLRQRSVPHERVVASTDREHFIHVVPDAESDIAAAFIAGQPCTLSGLGLEASTGPVVDFRALDLLRDEASEETVPLLYPTHLKRGAVVWPAKNGNGKKASSIERVGAGLRRLLLPGGAYVVVKRFTSKEETRRVVAALYQDENEVGIENHLNYIHKQGVPLDAPEALGLVVYLNSSHVDDYLRQFSGHTQINAGDLRSLRYPDAVRLKEIGRAAKADRLADPDYYDELLASSAEARS